VSWVPAEHVLGAVQQHRQVLAAEQARVQEFTRYHETEKARLDAERQQARHDLGQAVLPKLNVQTIQAAASAVGLLGLGSENIPKQVEERREWIGKRLATIERDPRYANAELLRHPRTGSLAQAIAQNEDYRAPLLYLTALCESHPRFLRLIDIGFGTQEAGTSWWRLSYWADRSAANEILARFPGRTEFLQVREEYLRAKEDLAVFDAELVALRKEWAAGEALAHEFAALAEEHRTLDERALAHTRERIVAHMLGCDVSLMTERLRSLAPSKAAAKGGLLLLFLRASGITAKMSYLEGVARAKLSEIQQDINKQAQSLASVEMRTRRRWAPMPLAKYQKLSEDKRARYEKRWQRFGKTYTTVHTYDRYDRGIYYQDLLWWDLMTRGRHDGSYLPEVRHFHDTHPNYQYDPDWKTLQQEHRALYANAGDERAGDYGDGSGAAGGGDSASGGYDDAVQDGQADDVEAAAAAAFEDSSDDASSSDTDTTRTDAS
jgi:hypothetical protein